VGRELYSASAVFKNTIDELDQVFERATGESLIRTYGLFGQVNGTKALPDVWPISLVLPSITMIQLALFDTLVSLGIKPNALIGHSAGETAILYASGAGSREMAMELSIARGKGLAFMERFNGTMAAVNCAPDQARSIISEVVAELGSGTLEIGCYNAPNAVTLSGEASHIALAVKKATDVGIFARQLRTKTPVHSSMMEFCHEEYTTLVAEVYKRYSLGPTKVPVYSSATGRRLDIALDAQYFWSNTVGPVRFADAMGSLAQDHENATYIELSPHPVLTGYLTTIVGSSSSYISPLRRANKKTGDNGSEVKSLLNAIGQLVVSGYNSVDFAALAGKHAQQLKKLPLYPFVRKHIPHWAVTPYVARFTHSRNGPLNYPQLRVNTQTHPSLAQHIIKGEPIWPAAAYLEAVSSSVQLLT
jgi:acyl transferase domain-containing protein